MTAIDRTCLPPVGPSTRFVFPPVRKSRLANGLRVWVIGRDGPPVLTALFVLPAGSSADPASSPGLAAITADLLDEGSAGRTALEFHHQLEGLGARLLTDVGYDATTLMLTTLVSRAGPALTLLKDVVAAPTIAAGDFERIRQLRLNRLAQLADHPSSLADRTFSRLLYGAHPYAHLPLGEADSLERLVRDDAVAFHRRSFRPEASFLILAGASSETELTALADEAFGDWHPDAVPGATPVPASPRPTTRRIVVVDRPGAPQSEIRVGQVAARRDTPHYHALLVLNAALGGQFTSRLMTNLRETRGLTYGVRSIFEFRRDAGPFTVQTSVQSDATALALGEIVSEIEGVRTERPVSAAELDLAKASLTRGYARGFETADQLARAAGHQAAFDLADEYFTEFPDRVAAVDGRGAGDAALLYLDPSSLATVVVCDAERVRPTLVEAGFTPDP